MARVTREQVTEYQTISQRIENAATDAIRELLGTVDLTDEKTWPDVIDYVVQTFGHYGNLSADLGSQWYQRCRDIQTDGKTTYTATPHFDSNLYGRITNEAKKILEDAKSGEATADEVVEKLTASVGNYVAKCNRDSVQENLWAENEEPAKSGRNRADVQKEKGYKQRYRGGTHYETTVKPNGRKGYRYAGVVSGRVRFMRVPRADCHCAFCITMASRGAVYKTRETAGGGDPVNRYHRDCRCSIVPVAGGDSIAGYTDELNGYYDAYADAYEKLYELWDGEHDGTLTGDDADLMARINAAREAHKELKESNPDLPEWQPLNEVQIVMRYQNKGMT